MTVLLLMSDDVRSKPGIYGEVKKQKCFMITDFASDEIDRVAKEYKMSRSDLLERSIRAGGLKLAKDYEIEKLIENYRKNEADMEAKIDQLAKEHKMSRSDLLELVIREGVLKLNKDDEVKNQE